MAPIKVGFVGFGFSTNCFHLPFVLPNPDLQVYAFLQRAAGPADAKRWGFCLSKFPAAKHYRTADEFFADDEIELVVICTHNHEEFIEKALDAGKHVVVEKPFTTTSVNAAKMVALAKEKGKVLTAFHNRRFDSDFRTLEFLVKEGALGEVMEAQMHFDFPNASWVNGYGSKYKPGDGMLFGFLRGNRAGGSDSEIDDTFTAILQYSGDKKNLVVTVKTAIVTNMKDQLKFFIRGTEGPTSSSALGQFQHPEDLIRDMTDEREQPQEAKAIAAPGEPATDPNFGMEDEGILGTLTTTKEFDATSQKLDEGSGAVIG